MLLLLKNIPVLLMTVFVLQGHIFAQVKFQKTVVIEILASFFSNISSIVTSVKLELGQTDSTENTWSSHLYRAFNNADCAEAALHQLYSI